MKKISYLEARARGLKTYFTGKKCIKGHIAERWVANCGCKQCQYGRTAEWNKKPRSKKIKSDGYKRFIERNPGYSSQWAKDNPDSIRVSKQKWYAKNSDREIKRAINWRLNNLDRARTHVRNRYIRRIKAKGSHTPEEILAMLRKQKWKCAACKVSIKKKRHIDHIVPLLLGGSNYIENLQGLCPSCNCSKNAKPFDVWLRERQLSP